MKGPPKYANRLLSLILRDDIQEEVFGDLAEKFRENPSRLNYWYQALNYIRPFAIKKRDLHPVTHIDMFRNYFKIGFRQMAKNKMYSFINIGGFAVGIAACLLLAIYIYNELTYDRFYSKQDQIYRIIGVSTWAGETHRGLSFAHPFGDIIKESVPEIEQVGYYNGNVNFGADNNEVRRVDRTDNTHEEKMIFANQGLLEVLEFPFIAGNPSGALTKPNTVVITQHIAERYFGNEDPIGKSLILNNDVARTYEVTGVIADFRSDSHFDFNFFLSAEADILFQGERTSWCCSNYVEYIRVRQDADVDAVAKKIADVNRTFLLADARKNSSPAEVVKWIDSFSIALQPVSDIYLNPATIDDTLPHGDIRFIWLFGSIALFILFLACINFINLSTARSSNRAKEVGIRKSIGSLRASIIRQFLAESLMYSVIALLIGVVLTQLSLPVFNNLIGKSIMFPWTQWWLIPTLVIIALAIGFIAGIYPAFYLSAFRPAKVLKGGLATGARNTRVRSILVIFQFTISIVLIVGTIIIDRQMQFAMNKDLGFDKDNVMILHGTITLGDKTRPFKQELEKLADVRSVTVSDYLPVNDGKRDGGPTTVDGTDIKGRGQQWLIDPDYVKTMGFRIVKGRDFDPKISSDSQAMIINQAMEKELNIADAVGAKVSNYQGKFTIIGVVEDFHYETLTQRIAPVTMFQTKGGANVISIKLASNDASASIESVSRVWQQFSPHQPIRFEFLDDRYAHTYNDVKRFGVIVKIFTTLAIVVACLGLFALSAFMIEQRGKEISIRMVLGAPVANILRLISQNFVMLVAISFVIAAPVAWYLMNIWLQDYVYRIDITWDVFVVTGASALMIALITIGYQSVKASMMNPVTNLKSE